MSRSSQRNARKLPVTSRITTGDRLEALGILAPDPGFWERHGRCYELSAKYVIRGDDPDAVVVHGAVTKGVGVKGDAYVLPFPVLHAWVIRGDGTVHDPVFNKSWAGPLFHAAETGAVVRFTYTADEANRLSLDTKHWGPWDVAASQATWLDKSRDL